MKNQWDVIVIGGGAAGMMAAGIAAHNGHHVLLIERNDRLGKKLFLTGKGRCNLTNASSLDCFMENIPRNPKFLYSAFNTFFNKDLMNFFEERGLKLKIERGSRVFPSSDKSSDVIKVLEHYIKEKKVKTVLNQRVKELVIHENNIMGLITHSGKKYDSSKIIIATGGASYTLTGSTGDGYLLARQAGHKIIEPEPSLVPVETNEKWVLGLQGLSLKNVNLSLFVEEKKVHEEFGEMLFTHFGISGPIVLTLSWYIKNNLYKKDKLYLSLDLKPALENEVLDKRLQRDFAKYSKRQFKNALDELLPQRLIPIIITFSKIDKEKYVNQITKPERESLVKLLKDIRMTVKGLRPIDEAIITSGGVSVKEINPSTMESKIIKGLYFAGEVIDVDALTGGFNLQIAFSTGYLAGISV